MDYKTEYQSKLITADAAAAMVKSGDWVDYGWAVNTTVAVDAALAKRLPQLENVNFRGGILMWTPAIFQIEDPAAHMTWNSWHMGGIERKAVAQGFSFYAPIRYSELPRYYRESNDPVNVAVFQVAPMDEHGYFNFGPSASHLAAVCEKAEKIIVEVNKNMPRCLGGFQNCIHIDQVTAIVEGDNPPLGQMAAAGPASEVDLAVANLIVPQIPNGACLQLGIGGMPNAIGSLIAQSDLKDLGVHTEMYVDGFVDIAAAGKIGGEASASALAAVLGNDPVYSDAACRALLSFNGDIVKDIQTALGGNSQSKTRAMKIASQRRMQDLAPEIFGLLNAEDDAVRTGAYAALQGVVSAEDADKRYPERNGTECAAYHGPYGLLHSVDVSI